MKFPCINCVVYGSCPQLCNRLCLNREIITEKVMEQKQCPDCGGEMQQFIFGFRNDYFQCLKCKHYFIPSIFLPRPNIESRKFGGKEQMLEGEIVIKPYERKEIWSAFSL